MQMFFIDMDIGFLKLYYAYFKEIAIQSRYMGFIRIFDGYHWVVLKMVDRVGIEINCLGCLRGY